jgi:APA family basic amino acid/polyamine antiporter
MARDGLFFRSVGRLTRRTRVPAVAILLQGAMAIVIALSGRYDQILSYVVAMDFLFFGLTGACLFVFRRRERTARAPVGATAPPSPGARVPGHPLTTALFVATSFLVVANTLVRYPVNSGIGLAILAAGVPVYLGWSRLGGRAGRRG